MFSVQFNDQVNVGAPCRHPPKDDTEICEVTDVCLFPEENNMCKDLIFRWWLRSRLVSKSVAQDNVLETSNVVHKFPEELFELLGLFPDQLVTAGYLQWSLIIVKEFYVIETHNYSVLNPCLEEWTLMEKSKCEVKKGSKTID